MVNENFITNHGKMVIEKECINIDGLQKSEIDNLKKDDQTFDESNQFENEGNDKYTNLGKMVIEKECINIDGL